LTDIAWADETPPRSTTSARGATRRVGWRGFAQSSLAPLRAELARAAGFWRASFLISGFCAMWHVPLLATYAHIDEAPWRELAILTLNLTLAGNRFGRKSSSGS
jgi:hypothetical protein